MLNCLICNCSINKKNKNYCSECRKKKIWSRNCPKCNKKLFYSYKEFKKANTDSPCKSCAASARTGSKNSFFGKKHTQETKTKISESLAGKPQNKNKDKMKKLSENLSGSKNHMYGKSLYDFWHEKYGQNIADEKMKNLCLKRSNNAKGNKNPMYGKEPTQGSGNGWSGWYKNVFFRSLRELSYIIFLEENNIRWETAANIKIPYVDWKGANRTYHPDFIIENKKIIEVKPIKLHNSPLVKLKTIAAIEYCKKNNLEYEIVDTKILSCEEIENLYNNKTITFIKQYEKKFISFRNKKFKS
jgi:hypothetical protein